MAKNIDDLQINVSVQGTAQIQETVTHVDNLDNSTKKVADSMRGSQQSIRNVAYQIQDLSVQIAGGTSAFVALGQQIPQLLGSFGTMGIVIGAVAAIAIPVLAQGLKIVGVDMRNLKERTDDLTTSVKNFKDAQQSNLATLQGLQTSFGDLTVEAKQFFEINEQLKQQKAYSDLSSSIQQLKKDFGFMNSEIDLTTDSSKAMGDSMMGAAINNTWLQVKAYLLGLTAEQAREVAKQIKNIDANDPKKTAETINDILQYLKGLGPEADNFRRKFEETYTPLLKINDAILEQKRNIKASGEEASALSAKLYTMQANSIPNVGNARRSFDQIKAIALEAAEKIREFNVQADQKTSKDQVNRTAEKAAFAKKTNTEAIEAQKDIEKAQQETSYAQQHTNELKLFQLEAQAKINKLQIDQVDTLDYEKTLEESLIKNREDEYRDLASISDLRRKNLITAEQEAGLNKLVYATRKQSDENAEQAIVRQRAENTRSIRLQTEGLVLGNLEKRKALEVEKESFYLTTNEQNYLKEINSLRNQSYRTIVDIRNNSKLSAGERTIAEEGINDQLKEGEKILQRQLDYRKEMDSNMRAGAFDRAKQITESFSNFKVGGMAVDAVFNQMNSALDKFVETGKLNFGDFARSVIMDLEKIALKSAVIGVFQSLGLGSIFGIPGRALGGAVDSNAPYIIGENGPELFIPNSAGRIIPNNKLSSGGGATTIINNHISAIDSRSVAQLFAENRMTMFGMVEQARRELPMRTR